mgnify:CR=1 FL=1
MRFLLGFLFAFLVIAAAAYGLDLIRFEDKTFSVNKNNVCTTFFDAQACSATTPSPVKAHVPWEASGITIDRNRKDARPLIIVGDENTGRYYACKDRPRPEPSNEKAADFSYFEIDDCLEYEIANASIATDLESIVTMNAGEYVVLSEPLRGLIIAHGETLEGKKKTAHEGDLKLQYGGQFSEIGGRGLEGLTIRPNKTNGHDIAALWEGGFPNKDDLVNDLVVKNGQDPNDPDDNSLKHVNINTDGDLRVDDADTILEVTFDPEDVDSQTRLGTYIEVNTPRPAQLEGKSLQRFRAPDLVWGKNTTGNGGEDTLILLISSLDKRDRNFDYKCLLEIGLNGEPTGNSLDINAYLSGNEDLEHLKEHANWEGLSWYDDQHLIIVNDNENRKEKEAKPWKKVPLTALIFASPEGWDPTKKCLPQEASIPGK